MGVAIAIALTVAAMLVHEFGHWVAMRHFGIEVDAIGIGFWRRKLKIICGVPVLFGVLPLGAYIRMTNEGKQRLLSLSYGEQALVYGAGIMANIFFSAVVLNILLLVMCHGSWRVVYAPIFWIIFLPPILIWFGRRFFCAMIPITGIIAAIWFGMLSMHATAFPIVGPIGLTKVIVHDSPTIVAGIIEGAVISLMWAALNAIPFVPTDGWNIFAAFLRKHRPGWVQPLFEVEFAFYIAILFLAFTNDLYR
jgi:membrane-associated protease RseP (regulator of RpoE activity)